MHWLRLSQRQADYLVWKGPTSHFLLHLTCVKSSGFTFGYWGVIVNEGPLTRAAAACRTGYVGAVAGAL